MIPWTIAFVAGIFFVFCFSELPSPIIPLIFIIFIAGLKFFFKRKIILNIILAFAMGSFWMTLTAHHVLNWSLPKSLEGKDLIVSGRIASIPEVNHDRVQFLFQMSQPKVKVRLNWYKTYIVPKVGDQWDFEVRLKRPHGLMNPGGFDYETWLFQHRIRATGYIIDSPLNRKIASKLHEQFIDRARASLLQNMNHVLKGQTLGPMIDALTLGVQDGITQDQWDILRVTGTSHLMAISGLHITCVAGFFYLLTGFFWRRIARAPLFIATPRVSAVMGLLAALIYSAMAGFSVPTQRALVMLGVYWGIQIIGRHVQLWHAFFLALLIVCVLDPLDVLSASCWLSFGAVAMLIYGLSNRLNAKGWWWTWGRAQWVVSIGLIPLSLFYFGQSSLISPLANVIAIPWVSFTVVPLSLIGCVCAAFSLTLSHFFLMLALFSLNAIWWILEKMASIPHASWQASVHSTFILVVTLLGVVLFLAPRGYSSRFLGLVGLLPLLCSEFPRPLPGEMWLTILDVGQGLATVVRTAQHNVVFDTGPAVYGGLDAGDAVVIPFLKAVGIKQLDVMVISHADNDHRGGAKAVLKSMQVGEILEGEPLHLSKQVRERPCRIGQHWQWDGVSFVFLYPPANRGERTRNNNSCVLKISTRSNSALLPGDIEKPAEDFLVTHEKELLSAQILVAPHHGSRTSSSKSFIEAVHPSVVVYPTGYRNRYRFPSQLVIRRYEALGTSAYNTAYTGAITFKLSELGDISAPDCWRQDKANFWSDQTEQTGGKKVC